MKSPLLLATVVALTACQLPADRHGVVVKTERRFVYSDSPNKMWVPGYWKWQTWHYVWVPGRYASLQE